jgi:hypothetical protein
VCSVGTDDEAMSLETTDFDLVLLGRNPLLFEKRLDQRIRQNDPKQLTLKVQPLDDLANSLSIADCTSNTAACD